MSVDPTKVVPAEAPADDHDAEPPDWAKNLISSNESLTAQVNELKAKQTPAPTPTVARDTNGNPNGTATTTTKVEVPAPVVAPKTPHWVSRLPKFL